MDISKNQWRSTGGQCSKAIAASLLPRPRSSAFLRAWSTSYMCSNCMAHGVDKTKFDVFSWNSIIDANVGCRIFGTIQHANCTFPFLSFQIYVHQLKKKQRAVDPPSNGSSNPIFWWLFTSWTFLPFLRANA